MALTKNSDIASLRAQLEVKREEAMALMKDPAVSPDEAAGFHLLAMELHDMDRALSDAVFLNNTSRIAKLVGEIEEATQAGEQARKHLTELRDAIVGVRQALRKGTAYLTRAKKLIDEVEALVDLAESGRKPA